MSKIVPNNSYKLGKMKIPKIKSLMEVKIESFPKLKEVIFTKVTKLSATTPGMIKAKDIGYKTAVAKDTQGRFLIKISYYGNKSSKLTLMDCCEEGRSFVEILDFLLKEKALTDSEAENWLFYWQVKLCARTTKNYIKTISEDLEELGLALPQEVKDLEIKANTAQHFISKVEIIPAEPIVVTKIKPKIPAKKTAKKKYTDSMLRVMWQNAGGGFNGPNTETGWMAESKLFPFLRDLINL